MSMLRFVVMALCLITANAYELRNPDFSQDSRGWRSKGAEFSKGKAKLIPRYKANYIAQKIKIKKGDYTVTIDAKSSGGAIYNAYAVRTLTEVKALAERYEKLGKSTVKDDGNYSFYVDGNFRGYLVIFMFADSKQKKNDNFYIEIDSVEIKEGKGI